MNNLLINQLPESVFIGNVEFEVNTNFRICILFELLMQDDEVPDSDKLDLAIDLFFEEVPEDLEAAIEFILWFYKCGVTDNQENGKKGNSNKKQAIYSFEHDSDYIYAAFLDQYGIDLNSDALHWWQFRALFKGLKSDNEIVKIMGYRAIEIDSDMSKEQQKHYRELKAMYALPDNRTEEEKEADFNDSFGGLF